jgi:hypothetical protein
MPFSVNRYSMAMVLVVLCVARLYLPRLIELLPPTHDLSGRGDDWDTYHRYALSVLDGGLTIPAVPDIYLRPAGFGYVYFVALVYAIFGALSEVVYLVQGCLLLGVIASLYWLFRNEVTTWMRPALLLGLAVYLWIDVFWYLTFRLLSENLLIFLIPPLVFFVLRGVKTGWLPFLAIAGGVCGLCVLARPNAALFAPAVAGVVAFGARAWSWPWRGRAATIFLLAFTGIALLEPLRDFVVTGRITVGQAAIPDGYPMQTDLGMQPTRLEKVATLSAAYARRMAYVIGLPRYIEPDYRIRPHWLVMWAGFAAYIVHLARRTPAFWELLILALCASYLLPLFIVGYLATYGFRMIAPAVPLVLLLAIKEADLMLAAVRRRLIAPGPPPKLAS